MYSLTNNLEATTAVSKRNTTTDLIRIIAAFGVVAIHVPFSTPAAKTLQDVFHPFCVPFFLITSLTLFVNKLKVAPVRDLLKNAVFRIALPYLAWTIIYGGLLAFKSLLIGTATPLNPWKVLFFGESAVHLYFLPELLVLQLLATGIFLIGGPTGKIKGLGLLFILLAIGYTVIGYIHDSFSVPQPFQVISYLSAAFLLAKKINNNNIHWRYFVGGLLMVILTLMIYWSNININILNISIANLLNHIPIGGIGLLLLAIGFPSVTMPNWLLHLSSMTFGIYLIHIFFLEALEFFFEKLLFIDLHYDVTIKLLVVATIFLLSTIAVILLRKISIFRFVLLGEKK
ncbi:acyltransferase family protein [Adhaeribacter aquaticus]|uniref:acyltransferase family protein n=1 Tax=Adhaeribacter aquaticus TaxID=299567 RepID=UPI000417729B|nr:acyltransferase family protein [Adhaeribacter aquaticus]